MEFYREMSAPVYKRVLLKISGESLQGNKGHGYDPEAVASVAARIREALETGVEIALVVGAGNIWRGLANSKGGMDRVTADQMGMLATAMNALCLKEAFRQAGVDCAVHSAVGMEPFLPRYNRDEALRQLAEHKLVLFACGTGSPFFTTTRPRHSARLRSRRRLCSKRPRSTGSTRPIRKRIPRRPGLKRFRFRRFSPGNWPSWTRRRFRSAPRTDCILWCSTLTSRAHFSRSCTETTPSAPWFPEKMSS